MDNLTNFKYLDKSTLIDLFGVESYAEASKNNGITKRASMNLGTLQKRYDADAMQTLCALVSQYLPEPNTSARLSQEDKNATYATDLSINLEAAARETIARKDLYRFLPSDLTRVIDKLKAPYAALEARMNEMTNSNSIEYFACKWKKDRYQQAMESLVFNTLTGAYKYMQDVNMGKISTEGVGMYSQAVFYPVFETAVQYANVAGTIYNKVCKVKQLLNEVTSIPVHTKKIYAVFFDPETGEEKDRVARELLYSKFDASSITPYAYQDFDRDVTITSADFNKIINLKKDKLTGATDPVLGPLEEVRSDFRVVDMVATVNGAQLSMNELYDHHAGLALADAMNEVDRKGKVFNLALDKANPDNISFLSFSFNNVEKNLSVIYTQTDTNVTLDKLTIRFHLHDPNMVNRPNMRMDQHEEQHFINAGSRVRYDISINNNEFAIINSRQTGDYLNTIVNLTAEYGAHQKEALFFKEFMYMYDDLKQHQSTDADVSSLDLFTERHANMNIANTNRKLEYINLVLAPQFDNAIQGLSIAANSEVEPQVNFFCHKATLPVINQALKLITGEVNQDTNGKFLGVNQDYSTHILTVGSDASSSVHSIVVASNKNDIKHKSFDENGDKIEVGLIEYPLYGLPYFKEANLETVLFTETATRITNSADVRSVVNPLIPSMIMETNIGFAKLRPAAAKIVISGYHTAPSVL